MGTRDEYIGSLKSAFVSIEVRVTMGLLASLPLMFPAWLAWFAPVWAFVFKNPLLRKLIEHFLKKFYTKKTDQAEMAVFFKYIDMRVGAQSKDFEAAALENLIAQKSGDKDAIEKAETNLFNKFEIFVRLDT